MDGFVPSLRHRSVPDTARPEEPLRAYERGQPKSLAGISTRSFVLGLGLGLAGAATVVTAALTESPLWRLPAFCCALALFHFLEFWTTATFNAPAAEIDSFLLTANWPGYALAHLTAFSECAVAGLLAPRYAGLFGVTAPLLRLSRSVAGVAVPLVGVALMAAGQALRSAAIAQAGASFHHIVQTQRAPAHTLVTAGPYAYARHPSYLGFLCWALGTQLLLGNVICLLVYAAVLWRFFRDRIRREEALLVAFFGDDYRRYRNRVPTLIPFIP